MVGSRHVLIDEEAELHILEAIVPARSCCSTIV